VRFIRQTISSFIKLSLLLLVLGWGSSAYSADLISPADNATVNIATHTFTWSLSGTDTTNNGLRVAVYSNSNPNIITDKVADWWSGNASSNYTNTTGNIDLADWRVTAGTYYWRVEKATNVWVDITGSLYTLIVDGTAPTLSSSTPADNATAVAISSNIVLNFSEAVDVESGNITIYKTSDGSTVETIDVTSGLVTGIEKRLNI
jgi:hypothetical protein